MSQSYSIKGNEILVQREVADLVKSDLAQGIYPTEQDLVDWMLEEVNILYLGEYELVHALLNSGGFLYASLSGEAEGCDTIAQALEEMYRNELEDRLSAWVRTLYEEIQDAEYLDGGMTHHCPACQVEADGSGPCPECDRPMEEMNATRNINLDRYFTEDIEDYAI